MTHDDFRRAEEYRALHDDHDDGNAMRGVAVAFGIEVAAVLAIAVVVTVLVVVL